MSDEITEAEWAAAEYAMLCDVDSFADELAGTCLGHVYVEPAERGQLKRADEPRLLRTAVHEAHNGRDSAAADALRELVERYLRRHVEDTAREVAA